AVIGGDDSKTVPARWQIVVEGLPPRAGLLPVAVVTLEQVAKSYLFRRDEAQGRVVDLQLARQCRERGASPFQRAQIVRLAVGRDLLDLQRWRKIIEGQAARIDDAHTVRRDEPQLSVGSCCYVWGVGR